MKAIQVPQFGDPGVMTLVDLPDPAPGPGQVAITVKAIGVNPVETYIRAGQYGPRHFPYVPGSDCAGVVESIGPAVKRFKVGDCVYTAKTVKGAYAQKVLAAETEAFALPPAITFAQGAALGVPAATAWRALFDRGKAQAGETILIHGATGGVGILAVQLARAAGLTIIGTGGSEEGRQLAIREGAHHVLDHTVPNYLDRLAELTEGRGVDLILEMLANVNLDRDLAVLAKHGRVVVVGNRGRIEIDPRQTMSRDADIRGMTLMNATGEDLRRIHAGIIAALEAGTLRPLIDQELPLADAARAHQEVMSSSSRGKIVLVP